MGVQRRGRRVGHGGSGDQARGAPAILGNFDEGLESMGIGATEVTPFDGCVDGKNAGVGAI